MELFSDISQIEVYFGLFGDSANLHARWGHDFALNVQYAQK
jgi:hypothetical protein